VTIDQIIESDDDLIERGDDDERSASYRQVPWWYIKNEGDTAILRLLEESPDWRKVLTHRFFPTKPEPEGHEGKWPDMMPATCRAGGKIGQRYPQGCAIDRSGYKGKYGKGSTAEIVHYTMAVERERYEDANGRRRYRDKSIQVPAFDDEGNEIEGQTLELPSIVLIGETMFRMMSSVKGTGEALSSLRTQDLQIKLIKNPSGKNGLIAQVIPLDKDPSIQPGTEHWEIYQHAQQLWKPGGLVLNREILSRASEEYWNRFFLLPDGKTFAQHQIERGAPADLPTATASAASVQTPDADKLAAMKARITKS
jgi:hypothetical protein